MNSFLVPILNLFATSSNPTKPNDYDPICKFQNPSDPNMVIIFFHDLLWDGADQQLQKTTWMSSCEPPASPVCWPETWLSTKYPRAQILSGHYDAAIKKGNTAGHMDLFKLSENLWQDILPHYRTEIPVFLVGHGLGGLVIKALVLKMQEEQYSRESRNSKDWRKLKSFLKNVKGILYYSTPFLGSELANYMKNPHSTSSLLDDLTVLNTNMCRLNYLFSHWRNGHRECSENMILEGSPTKVGSWYGHLVGEAAARYNIDGLFYTVYHSDHFDVCKPRSLQDIRFRRLIQIIDEVMSSLTSVSAALIEDNAKGACVELLKNILLRIQEVRLEDRGVLLLSIDDDLTPIRKFEDLWRDLQDRLYEAGLKKTSVSAHFEYYE